MAAPEGYVALDLIGFTDKGDYAAGTAYVKNDLVHSDNRIYLSLQDNNVGNALPVLPATETTYWKLWLSGGSDNLDDLTAKDTSNLMGTGAGQVVVAQALIDAMASKIVQQNSDFVGYINTQRTIHTFENSVPYTATENCIVAGKINLKQGSTCHVWLGAVSIGSYSAPTDSNMYITIYVPLKAGQAISINPSIEPAEFLVKAYGLL